jgi:superfamily II DNA or RNA helicase
MLISDVNLFNTLPKDCQNIIIQQKKSLYEKYDGLLDLFGNLNEKNIDELMNAVLDKLNKGKNRKEILELYGKKWEPIVTYILDTYKKQKIALPEEENNISGNIYNENVKPTFIWSNNQINGWNNAINSDFTSGIHSQATGTGKSLMALKIIWEYHKKYSKNNVMWLCERKDIPQKLFFTRNKNNEIVHNEYNFDFWKKNDIIDMHEFTVMDFVYNKKDNNWIEKWSDYTEDKPLFVIINRAYLTTKSNSKSNMYTYQDLKNNQPGFIIIDECHSAMASSTYQFLLYAKWNWKSNIQGLSATPYRKGKSYTTIKIDIDCPDMELIRTQENENKLIQIFHKQGNVNEINILSWFNLKEAIESEIILEPIFHWFNIGEYKKKSKQYSGNEKVSILSILNKIIEECKYKKCIVWCRLKTIADEWYEIFKNEKYKFHNLKNIDQFIDHSGIKSQYDKFYNLDDNAIMFCASKFREGSDIPYLSCCMFLDKVHNRGELPFIQCIGRVLRKDCEGLKNNGHIIDGCTIGENENKMEDILNKLLKYYIHLYEFTRSDFEFSLSEEESINAVDNNKINIYNDIMKSLRLVSEEKKIYIDLKNQKKITLDLNNIHIKTMEWKKIIPNFEVVLKNVLVMCEYEEYVSLKKRFINLGILDVYQYDKKWKEYGLYTLDTDHGIIRIDPKKRYPTYFKNWYDFLDVDASHLIGDKTLWRKKCLELNLTPENYLSECIKYDDIPIMPGELYHDFTNLIIELTYDRARR